MLSAAYLPIATNQLGRFQGYLISGAESLLIEQTIQRIRQYANQNGFSDRQCFFTNQPEHLGDIRLITQSQGLFASASLIEIHLHNANLPSQLKPILSELCMSIPNHCLVLIIAAGIQLKSANWVKQCEQNHLHLQYPKLTNQQQQKWLENQLSELDLQLDESSKKLLLTSNQGNLVGLYQEINQLHLEGLSNISYQQLLKRIEDQAKFNPFSVASLVLSKQAKRALRMCRNLRRDEQAVIAINWSIYNEAQLALGIAQAERLNRPLNSLGDRIWPSRLRQLKQIARLGEDTLQRILQQSHLIDKQAKGRSAGDSWLSLEKLIAEIAYC